ncbi:ThiF family adenylyltransferase [Frankia sp. AgB32]|uniref:ThiF family adenylyltransferase n=1 Tax=Frankia sp. AgB32 TaxID=631119 RepID=UPI00200E15FB|nr:ThiF family adenylyltransferase [Frankia sp. AgB32]MCK9897428.1 ThiF family adenylyltransferase [Frankia sp. AgB32]
MRPILKPGLRRLWHDGSTLQLGIDPVTAVILADLRPADTALLDALDGRRTLEQVRLDAGGPGRHLLDVLTAAGLLHDAGLPDDASAAPGTPPLPPAERDRLAPDLAALSLRSIDPARPSRVLRARRAARVLVRGAGRVGAQIAALLAAAGIGRIVVDDPGLASPADVSPGGLRLEDVGRPRALAAGSAMTRVGRGGGRRSAETDVRAPGASGGSRPGTGATGGAVPPAAESSFGADLMVLAPVGPPTVAPDTSLELERLGGAHLLAGVRENTGIVGPLVVPARTACLHCQHLHRHAANPVWPLLAMQLVRPRGTGHDPCDVTLASMVAALAAMQALDYLDHVRAPAAPRRAPRWHGPEKPDTGRTSARPDAEICDTFSPASSELPATADGTLELASPGWRIRRRSWPVHPNCPCRSARTAARRAAAGPAVRPG